MYDELSDKLEESICIIDDINNSINQDDTPNWDTIQENYDNFCKKLSPGYLSGSWWYQVINNDCKSAYFRYMCTDNKQEVEDTLISMFCMAIS